jgi:NAD+ diphosphatase
MPPTNTFAGASIDRVSDRRTDPEWVAAQMADPAARAIVISQEGPFVDLGNDPCRPAFAPLSELDQVDEPVLLGIDARGPLFAVEGDSLEGARTAMSLRDAGARMSQEDGGLLAYATAITGWHRNHRFCARCGHATDMTAAGHERHCPGCGATHHPRTDPVVIMLVHDGDRVLLGRQARWPAGRYSTLAGFVEPGESLEEAVAREVAEEAGVAVADIRYRSSQPWPFPASLMLGFHARYDGGEPAVRDQELEDVRWFARHEIERAVTGESDVHLPPPVAIARRLIDEWLEDTNGSA